MFQQNLFFVEDCVFKKVNLGFCKWTIQWMLQIVTIYIIFQEIVNKTLTLDFWWIVCFLSSIKIIIIIYHYYCVHVNLKLLIFSFCYWVSYHKGKKKKVTSHELYIALIPEYIIISLP